MSTPLSSGPHARPRIKFTWGSSDVINARWRLGLAGFYERSHGFPNSGFAISVRGALRWIACLTLAGYLAGAFALSRWFARSSHNEIGLVDVLTWPVRRPHVATLRGRAWIAQGLAAMETRRWADGAFLLRRGLDRCPGDFTARLTLAQFYVLAGQRTRALPLLTDGPLHGSPPRAWAEDAFALLAAGEDWASALLLCERALLHATGAEQWSDRQHWLARQAEALIALDRPVDALALATAEHARAAPPLKIQHGRALLALGRADDAVEFLARRRADAGAVDEPAILRLHAEALRVAGRFDDMERTLGALRALHPARPEPAAFGVEQHARAGRDAAVALDDYIFRFGGRPTNLLLVAKLLAEVPDASLLQRVLTAAAERGHPLRPLRVQLAHAYLRTADWPALARIVAELEPQFLPIDRAGRIWFEWVQSLSAAIALPESRDERLAALLQSRECSLDMHRLTASALRRAGCNVTARDVLSAARRRFPGSPGLRIQQAEVDRILAVAPAPVVAPAPTAPPIQEGDFFRDLEAAVAAGRWIEAQRRIEDARLARPALEWLPARTSDLDWNELRIAQELGDIPILRRTARYYLNSDSQRAEQLLALASELHRGRDPSAAMILLQTVREKFPDHAAARRLWQEWTQLTEG